MKVKDKRFFKPTISDYECCYPGINPIFSMVTGEKLRVKTISANESRSFERFCGVNAVWFEELEK